MMNRQQMAGDGALVRDFDGRVGQADIGRRWWRVNDDSVPCDGLPTPSEDCWIVDVAVFRWASKPL